MNKLWKPEIEDIKTTIIWKFCLHINKTYDLNIGSFSELYDFSISRTEEFWGNLASFLDIKFHIKPTSIVDNIFNMPYTKWFEGTTLNYAENLLKSRSNELAIYEINETGFINTITTNELYNMVSQWVQYFESKGISKGDRVAGILPNNVSALVAMLAATSLGAVWSSCSPDFGEQGISDRLKQINPKCIVSISDYVYKGKDISISDRLDQIRRNLDTTELWILASDSISKEGWTSLSEIEAYKPKDINFVSCEFSDPLFILFSSGTTGIPKCIVHSVGGTLLQHMKEHQLHCNLSEEDTLFYYTTCGWMMWNWMVSALASQVSLILYDGAAISANNESIWDLIKSYNISVFGCSASFISASEKRNIDIEKKCQNKSLRLLLSTGSPLLSHHYEYLYQSFNYPIQVGSISGGTDIISCFALCNPMMPVIQGQIQARGLGMDVVAMESDVEIINKKGELVCKKSAPSMPIYFLNDNDYSKYKSAYFEDGASKEWIHGDYIIIHDNGGVEILGRSDSTLNPGGIRIGTAEFYQILESFQEIEDCLVSSVIIDNEEKIVLFVKLFSGTSLAPELKRNIRYKLKEQASPRHMPQMIVEVSQIPYTKNGKKCEVGVKKILRDEAAPIKVSTLLNEQSLEEYIQFAKGLNKS